VYGTDLRNPDFAAYARAFGAHGETVVETAEFAPAFERSLAAGRPSLIDVHLDPQAITTQTTLDAIRAKALAQR
jgi:acetolactate synthase-1/2/3 large subunit